MSSSLIEHFSNMKDPRILKKCDHLLIDILVITVCASLCRFDESWESIKDFAHLKKNWLQKFLKLPNGIPSYDTIRRVFLLLNPVEFQDCFQSWAHRFKKQIDGEITDKSYQSKETTNADHGRIEIRKFHLFFRS